MLSFIRLAAILLFLAVVAHTPTRAHVLIRVDIPTQMMHVSVNGVPTYTWPVATARRGYHTPRGSFRPQALVRMHHSRKYHNSPMPHSIFFSGGYAIHGSYDTVGRPASHGCVRLYPNNAATLYGLVSQQSASIVIQ